MKNWLRVLVAGFLLSCVAVGAVTASDITYTYDALGRLTGVDYGAAGGQETITYDAAGNRTSRIISGANVAPIAVNDSITTDQNTLKSFDPRINDSDPQGDPLTIVGKTNGAYGAVAIVGGTSLTYTPTTNYHGADSFTYTVSDGAGHNATATVSVTVSAVNQAPSAADDSLTVAENISKSFDPRVNDTDSDGDTLTITAKTDGGHGVVIIDGGTSLIYNPATGYTGPDSFTYTISDGQGHTAVASVTVTVINSAPVAVADIIATTQNVAKSFYPLVNDTDVDGDTLSVTSATDGAHGAVMIAGGVSLTYTPASGYNGSDSFNYTISDGKGHTATASVSVTVSNGAPVATADAITTDQNVASSFDPRANDSDPDGDELTITAKTNGAHGAVTIVGGASLIYTPTTNYNGSDSFTYTISDGQGHTATATVAVTVTPVNQVPVAVNDTINTAQNTAKSFDPRINDSDYENDPLTITAKTDGSHGAVTIVGGVSLTYTPTANYNGSDSFTYTISDGQGHTATATVSVTVANTAPTAVADSISTPQNVAKTFDPRLNDTDVDGDILTITAKTNGAHGVVVIDSGTALIYTPAAGYNGADSFTYTITDGQAHTSTATVTVVVTNSAPVAVADALTTDQNVAGSFDPRANDTDSDSDPLTITTKTDGAHGTVAIVGGVSLTYTPTTNYNGPDSFTYTISDGQGHTATATVTVAVTAVNQVPVAANDSISTGQNTAKTFDPRINDTDFENDTLTITAKTDGSHGTVAIVGGTSLVYTPTTNYNGSDSFTYTISDGNGHTATATVAVTITNTAPVAVADSISTGQNTPKTFDPRANDTDVDADTLTITAKTDGAHGTVVIATGTSLTYTPTAGYNGADSFTYTISDGQGHTATATVTVAVVNSAPVAMADTISTAQNVAKSFDPRANDTDVDGDTLTIAAKTDGAHGSVTIVAGASLIYTPATGYNGSDSFTYTISDGQGHTTAATVSVTVTNSAPVAVADAITTGQNTAKTFDPRANDTDADGDTLTISAKTNGAHGAVVINAGTSLTFTPTAGYSGADAFTYTISDGQGHTATATVSVTVSAVNQAPVAVNDIKTVKKNTTLANTTLTFDPRANDSDPDGDQISVISTSVAAHGSLSVFNNMISYVPVTNYTGTDTFTYTISDGQSHTASATVSVSITANGAPVAVNDSISTPMNEYKGFVPTLNDSDPEGNTLSIAGMTNGAHGTVASGANPLVLIYTPATGYVGADSFTYTISDGNGNTATAVVSVAVGTPNNAPVAVNDSVIVVMNTTKNISPLTNDFDADGDSIAISTISSAAHGTASIASGGTRVIYTPVNGYSGADSFTYTISDGGPHTATATVSISVGANHVPTAVSDSVVLAQSASTITISPMGNDVDLDGDTLTVTAVTNGTRGTVTKTASSVKYTRTVAKVPGTDSFTYTISDGNGGTAVGTVSVTTNNIAPTAVNDTIKGILNATKTFNPLANDSDADGNTLTITAKTNGLHGLVAITSATTLSYTPVLNYNGADSFTYTISDGWTQTATATVYVVMAANSAPVAVNDSGSVPGNLTTNMVNLRSNDSDLDGDALTIVATTNGAHGTVTLVSGSVVSYTPVANYYGEDSFTYTISDGQSHTATATVSGHVIARPIANNDNIVAGPKSWIKLSPAVLQNDSSPSGDALSIKTLNNGVHGVTDKQFANGYYVTNGAYLGSDSFTYTLAGGAGASTANDSLPATVSVAISAGKFAAVDDYVSLPAGGSATFDPRANDINTLLDGDGETSEVFFNSTLYGPYSQDQGVAFTTPSHGSVTYHVVGLLAADGFVYKPTVGYSGPDSFQYTVFTQDADGNYYFATGTVHVNVQ